MDTTPFHLVEGAAHHRTLILPALVKADKRFIEVGTLTRVEAKELVVAYSFDLKTNDLGLRKLPNPNAGKEHVFHAWRLKKEPIDPVFVRKTESVNLELRQDDEDGHE